MRLTRCCWVLGGKGMDGRRLAVSLFVFGFSFLGILGLTALMTLWSFFGTLTKQLSRGA